MENPSDSLLLVIPGKRRTLHFLRGDRTAQSTHMNQTPQEEDAWTCQIPSRKGLRTSAVVTSQGIAKPASILGI